MVTWLRFRKGRWMLISLGTERTLEKCAFRGYMGKETPAGWEVGGPGCPPDLTQSAHRKSSGEAKEPGIPAVAGRREWGKV